MTDIILTGANSDAISNYKTLPTWPTTTSPGGMSQKKRNFAGACGG